MKKLTLNVGSAVAIFLTASAVFITPLTAYSQALEEITVTARKTTESLQEVPLSITALGAEDIKRLGIKDLADVVNQDTSVQFDEGFTPSDTRVTIRGLSPTRGRPNAASLVDGIDLTSEAVSNAGGTQLINPRLLDIERIEIVKGPQSALFGRSAFAGAIQYITKDPADTLQAEISMEGDSEDAQEIRANVSIPLTDTLGVLINGAAFDARGIYKNEATGDYVGGGDGMGGSITFKWEPTDTLAFKWRTEYSDDNYDIAPQTLLNDRNKLVDLDVIAPLSGNCGPGAPPAAGNGPLDNYGCLESALLNTFFTDGNPNDSNGTPKDLGDFDPTDPWQVAQYNKQIVSVFEGKFPDGDDLDVKLSPNYQFGRGANNPANAKDYDGTEKDVFRTSLVGEWAYSDDVTFNSYTSYMNSTVWESLDIGKHFVDECSQDVAAISAPGTDPLGGGGSYADEILANNPQLTPADLAAFAPCNSALGSDGIHDGSINFAQNSKTETQQLSQELRGSWQITESINVTSGLLYWYEDVEQTSRNSTTISGGPYCFLGFTGGDDFSQDPVFGPLFGQLDPFQDQCGASALPIAYWAEETYQGRLIQPDTTERNTKHYSWYGSLDMDLTDKLSARLEARYTREDNEVTGLVQNPCLNPDDRVGDPGCTTDPSADRTEVGAGGQATGPSAVLLCGQTGRCDRLGLAPQSGSPYYAGNAVNGPGFGEFDGFSWWNWGYQPMPGTPETLKKTDRFWAPKATFEYYWTDDVMTYFSWSRGIKPGGFSLLTTSAFGLDANLDGDFSEVDFDEERLDVWEIGAKTTLFDGRVRLNGSAYYQDFKDKQVTVQAVVGNTVGTRVENISGSEIWGAEFDATWQINDNWRVAGGYTWLQSEYTDYEIITRSENDIARIQLGNGQGCQSIKLVPGADPSSASSYGCQASFNGNKLERAPRNAFQASVNFTDDLLDTGYEWYTEVSTRYQDKRYVEAFNLVEFKAYSITDWRLGIVADDWEVTGFVDNVFDDDTIITGGSLAGIPTGSFGFGASFNTFPPGINAGPKLPGDIYAQLGNPRIAGLRATFRFGD